LRLAQSVRAHTTNAGTTRYIHNHRDKIIAEVDATGKTIREYVWLDDMPVGVLDGSVNPATPTLLYVHPDHLNRPILMTNAAKAIVWRASYEPFGAVHQITGPAANDNRFPGQLFQLESGLAYNWHRHYDASIGRYTQADPLGLTAMFSDGPSTYGYAGQSPLMKTDQDGLDVDVCVFDGNGPNVFGHVGFSTPGDIGTHGFYARDGARGPGIVKPDDSQQIRTCKRISATPLQDQCMRQCRKDRADNPGEYSLLSRQCTSFVRDCLKQCSLPFGNPSGARPRQFFNKLPGAGVPEINPWQR
jgi:RHS repeat-associated protein